jgi:hypothetical protein
MAARTITPEMVAAFDDLESKCLFLHKELTGMLNSMLRKRRPCVEEAARLASEHVAAKFDEVAGKMQGNLDKINDKMNSLRPLFKHPVVLRLGAKPDKKRPTH